MSQSNSNLRRAKQAKKDEFYTRYETIAKELEKGYTESFKNQQVGLPCDNPAHSNFFRYYQNNFLKLGIKSLISHGYEPKQISHVFFMERTSNDEIVESCFPMDAYSVLRSQMKETKLVDEEAIFNSWLEFIKTGAISFGGTCFMLHPDHVQNGTSE